MNRWEASKPWVVAAAGAIACAVVALLIVRTDLRCLAKAEAVEGVVAVACLGWALWIGRNRGNRAVWRAARVVALLLSSTMIFFVSSTRPTDIDIQKLDYTKPSPVASADSELIRLELQKANAEIQLRVGQEDTWFHYKFLLIGALLAAFGGAFTVGARKADAPDGMAIASSPTTCMLLALSCVVALAIDIHLRNNIIVIQQLGLWIRYYAEPALMPAGATGFVPWEGFLRTRDAGMHSDNLYGFLFYPHLHFLTWVVYTLYLCCYQSIVVRDSGRLPHGPRPHGILTAGFVGVHISFAVFAWVGHFVPGALTTNVIPFAECWHTGLSAARGYLWLSCILFLASLPFVSQSLRLARGES